MCECKEGMKEDLQENDEQHAKAANDCGTVQSEENSRCITRYRASQDLLIPETAYQIRS